MNSLSRIQAALTGEWSDRRALSMLLPLYGARLTECPLTKHYSDPVAYADGMSEAFETFHSDVLFGPFAVTAEGEAFGSQMALRGEQAPILARPVINGADQIEQLELPAEEASPTWQ